MVHGLLPLGDALGLGFLGHAITSHVHRIEATLVHIRPLIQLVNVFSINYYLLSVILIQNLPLRNNFVDQ